MLHGLNQGLKWKTILELSFMLLFRNEYETEAIETLGNGKSFRAKKHLFLSML